MKTYQPDQAAQSEESSTGGDTGENTKDKLSEGVSKEAIAKVIEDEINPQLQLHAGGAELIDYKDKIVTLKLYGGCSGCPSSTITLFNGIVPILKEHFPEIEDVVLD